MREGNMEQIGAPLDLYDRPETLFVAGFIGSPAMNMLEGRIEGGEFRTGALGLPLPAASTGGADRPVVYGIRPEHIRLAPNGVPAEVVVVEPTGPETQVVAKLGNHEITCVFRERLQAGPGETIHILPDPALVHLFDRDSGRRLN
jgi:multiple sugar transport system ATP-binding protein